MCDDSHRRAHVYSFVGDHSVFKRLVDELVTEHERVVALLASFSDKGEPSAASAPEAFSGSSARDERDAHQHFPAEANVSPSLSEEPSSRFGVQFRGISAEYEDDQDGCTCMEDPDKPRDSDSQKGRMGASSKQTSVRRERGIDCSHSFSLTDLPIAIRDTLSKFDAASSGDEMSGSEVPSLCNEWLQLEKNRSDSSTPLSRRSTSRSLVRKRSTGEQIVDDEPHHACRHLFASPDSIRSTAWSLARVVFMLYDIVRTPLEIFGVSGSFSTLCLDFCVGVFWTLNIPVNFLTGFYVNGLVEMRAKSIALRYAKTWLIPDVILAAVDLIRLPPPPVRCDSSVSCASSALSASTRT